MAQATQNNRWLEIQKIWQDNRWLYVIAGVLLGILITPAIEQITGHLNDLIGNLVPEAVGIIFTVLILDRLADNRSTEQLKKRLIREAGSSSNETTKAAIDWMKHEGWLREGEGVELLKGVNLSKANLKGANLRKANLRDTKLEYANLQYVRLYKANLQGADLKDAILQDADLRAVKFDKKTRMPDSKYWTPETDMTRYTDPNHPDFWQPDWVTKLDE